LRCPSGAADAGPSSARARIASGSAGSWDDCTPWAAPGGSAPRQTLDRKELGARAVNEVLAGDWLPPHLVSSYENVTEQLIEAIDACFEEVGRYPRAADSRRLPPQQRAMDRCRPALRGLGRLRERPGCAGPVVVPRGPRLTRWPPSSATCSKVMASFCQFDYRELQTDRGAAGAALDALQPRGSHVAGTTPAFSARVPVVRRAALLGGARAGAARAACGARPSRRCRCSSEECVTARGLRRQELKVLADNGTR